MVDSDGRASIASLDLIASTSDLESTEDITEEAAARLVAPEILKGSTTTKAADVFAFAMLVIEVWLRDVIAIGHH